MAIDWSKLDAPAEETVAVAPTPRVRVVPVEEKPKVEKKSKPVVDVDDILGLVRIVKSAFKRDFIAMKGKGQETWQVKPGHEKAPTPLLIARVEKWLEGQK